MRTRTSIYLGGQALHALDQRIVIQSINEDAAKLAPRAVAIGGHVGQRMTALDRQTLDIDVRFCVLGVRDTRGRAEVLERVAAWAHGAHVLTVDYRPDRQLHVVCVQLPALGNAKEWTDEYTVVFRAYEQPYWESVTETVTTATGINVVPVINMPGTEQTELEFEAKAKAAVNTMVVESQGRTIAFTGLGMANGETLIVRHDKGLMQIVIRNAQGAERSAYSNRVAESNDEVLLNPGANSVTLKADGACDWTVKARGRWL